MIFEVFTEFENDRDSLSMLNQSMIKHSTIKTIAKKVLGDTVYEKIKELKQSKKTKSNYD